MSCGAMNENPATLPYQNAEKQDPSPRKTSLNNRQFVAQQNYLDLVTDPPVTTWNIFRSR